MRSRRSPAVSSVAEGMMTTTSFIAASITSHIATWLESWTTMRSRRRTPCPRRKFATRLERSDISAKLSLSSGPPSSAIQSAGFAFPRA